MTTTDALPLSPGPRPAADACPAARPEEPIVTLTYARSGVARLAAILQQHPDVCHIPGVDTVSLCGALAVSWQAIEGTADGSPSPGAVQSIKSVINAMVLTRLAASDATRWTNSAVGTAGIADSFASLYPQAMFLCLHRSCADTIYSGLAACPWGLTGYGFDGFAAAHPGNAVAALADYWATHTERLLEFEQRNPGQCHRVRYEDLDADPGPTLREVYAAGGLAQPPSGTGGNTLGQQARLQKGAPGTPEARAARQSIATSWKFTLGSVSAAFPSAADVGCGSRIPTALIPEHLAATIDDLSVELHYPALAIGAS
jgi:Sulfotransferase family